MFSTKVSLIKSFQCLRSCYPFIPLRSCSSNQSPINNRNSNRENLQNISKRLSQSLPDFFISTHCFDIYHKNIVFEDNIRNVKTIGINGYVKQIAFVKLMAHLKYSHKKFNVLKITEHTEDCTVRVRWRVVGTPGLSIIFMFWRYKLWNSKEMKTKDKSEWTDGFSIFYVGSDGLIHKHVVQKTIQDEERDVQMKPNDNINIKLAFIIGLVSDLPQLRVNLFENFIQKAFELSTSFGPFG